MHWDIERLASTGSTNSDVLARAREGAGEGLVLVADHQDAGRGRAGRTWTAPPGSALLCTVLLRPPAPVAPLVTFALALAAAQACEEVAGVEPGLKWPNDLVIEADAGTRKLAGILAEAEWPSGSHIAAGYREPAAHERVTVAAGIGLNVTWPEAIPGELADIAISLDRLTDRTVTRDEILDSLLVHLASTYHSLITDGAGPTLDAWRQRSATLGRRVRVDLGADELEGMAVDVDDAGHLVVDTVEGERRVLAVGDVVHLRPLQG